MGLGLGPFELVLIFFVMLLLFGAKRLPELANGMGKGIRDFKRALNGVDEQSIQANAQQNYLAQPAVPVQGATVAGEPLAVEGEPRRLS
ncbi:Sec-independent protein translocase subunit TatA/TatB [Longimicrobium sp.]|uniref:Sec-independent protein translocase subunit TatA/TatB n=1 Tax=Longimicrobium sp. TaxID=2029185 RepID=UPI003B3B439C